MDKRQYFIEALQAKAYIHKAWIISCFAVVRTSPPELESYPYQIKIGEQEDDDRVYFLDPNDNTLAAIDGCSRKKSMFHLNEQVEVEAGTLPNLKEKVVTTYGRLLYNAMVLVYAFGDKLPYMNEQVNPGKLEKLISTRLRDNVKDGEEELPDKLYVHEYIRYAEATSALAGLTPIDVPAASPKTMSVNPAVIKRRNELLLEYKDQLKDPAIIAKIEAELVAMDKEWFKGDSAEAFFIKGSSFDVQRKRSFIMFGAEMGFNDSSEGATLVIPSLQEGWDIKKLPTMAETLRAGSYNRGHMTALGGEAVKNFYRTFQNSTVIEDDCGTAGGLEWTVTVNNVFSFAGLYQVHANGKTEALPITQESYSKDIIGKRIKVRSPMLCKSKAPSFCARCVGDALAATPTGLHIAASDVGSTFMLAFMKKMHGTALKTAEFDFKQSFT